MFQTVQKKNAVKPLILLTLLLKVDFSIDIMGFYKNDTFFLFFVSKGYSGGSPIPLTYIHTLFTPKANYIHS